MLHLHCSMQDLDPWSGIKPRCPALRAQNLSPWTTREAPGLVFSDTSPNPFYLVEGCLMFLCDLVQVMLSWLECYIAMQRPSQDVMFQSQIILWPLTVQFSRSVVSDSLWPHGLQHTRPPCPSPTPRVYSNSCPLSLWYHPAISSSVVPFSSRLQSFPASGSFPMSQFFTSGGRSIGVSASTSVLPMSIQDWFPLGWDWLDLLTGRDSQESSSTPQFKSINSSVLCFLYSPCIVSHPYMMTGKP